MSELTSATLQLPDSITMEYCDSGQGVPVLFLHGYSDSWFSFSAIAEQLADETRSILLTHRGHGGSEKSITDCSMKAMARDALGLLDELNVSKAVLAGHSMGTLIAQEIAMIAPERIMGISLVGGALSADNEVLNGLSGELVGFQDPVDPEFVAEFQHSTVVGAVDAKMMSRIIHESLKMPARFWKPVLDALIDYRPDSAIDLAGLPTMVHWGSADEIFPRADQDVLCNAIPHAEFIELENVGHGLHWECADRYAVDLTEFVARSSQNA